MPAEKCRHCNHPDDQHDRRCGCQHITSKRIVCGCTRAPRVPVTPKQIYKITYPNGKIYVGMDLTGDLLYLGSPSAVRQISADLNIDYQRFPHKPLKRQSVVTVDGNRVKVKILGLDLVIRKDILWESKTATDREVRTLEMELIRQTGANNPAIGYNKVPRYAG